MTIDWSPRPSGQGVAREWRAGRPATSFIPAGYGGDGRGIARAMGREAMGRLYRARRERAAEGKMASSRRGSGAGERRRRVSLGECRKGVHCTDSA